MLADERAARRSPGKSAPRARSRAAASASDGWLCPVGEEPAHVEPTVASSPASATREANKAQPAKRESQNKSVLPGDAPRRASEQGFLSMSLDAYLKLLDWTGRQVRAAASGSSQRGVIPSDLQPILDRLRIVGDSWLDSVRHFGRWFHRAVGSAENVQSAATRAGKRWFTGIGSCRQAFS